MIVSSEFLRIMVSIALTITIVTPIILIALWVKDWIKGQLW